MVATSNTSKVAMPARSSARFIPHSISHVALHSPSPVLPLWLRSSVSALELVHQLSLLQQTVASVDASGHEHRLKILFFHTLLPCWALSCSSSLQVLFSLVVVLFADFCAWNCLGFWARGFISSSSSSTEAYLVGFFTVSAFLATHVGSSSCPSSEDSTASRIF